MVVRDFGGSEPIYFSAFRCVAMRRPHHSVSLFFEINYFLTIFLILLGGTHTVFGLFFCFLERQESPDLVCISGGRGEQTAS